MGDPEFIQTVSLESACILRGFILVPGISWSSSWIGSRLFGREGLEGLGARVMAVLEGETGQFALFGEGGSDVWLVGLGLVVHR